MARRTILVTGATDGIGLALVRRLAGRHDVIATGRREPGKVRDLFPEGVHYVRADQSDPKAAAQALGRGLLERNVTKLDHVVLNAAVGHASAPQDETPDTIRRTLDVNLAGTLAMAHILYSWLRRGNGQLTLIGSTARKGAPQLAGYAASKAGLHGLARALEEEWRGTVRVVMLHPGPTMTDMHEKAGLRLGWTRNWFIRPDDMAAMIEAAIRAGKTPRNLSFMQYLSGAAVLGRTIR